MTVVYAVIRYVLTAGILSSVAVPSHGFAILRSNNDHHVRTTTHFSSSLSSSSSSSLFLSSSSETTTALDDLNLTPELTKMVEGFARLTDEKVRYKNLVYLANNLAAVNDDVRVPGNKVPGCLSTVHITCELVSSDEDDDRPSIQFRGDSDGILTKGLLAMLVRGLSGCTVQEIEAVNPEFIEVAGIAQTLTPGRNNGFLNMMDTMKRKARESVERGSLPDDGTGGERATTSVTTTTTADDDASPLYKRIMAALTSTLKPTEIELDERGLGDFRLRVVADAFDGMAVDNREQLICLLLGAENTPQRFEIEAKSPSEVL